MLLPLAICGAIGLYLIGWHRGAAAWAIAIGGTLATMLALKLACLGCVPDDGRVFSPSGHTAASAAVYGGAGALWLRHRYATLPPTAAVALAAGAIVMLIGASRLLLHVHSPAEVATGAVVGLSFTWLLVRLAGAAPPGLRAGRVLLAVLPLMVLLHGVRLEAEPRLRLALGWLPASVCAKLAP